MARRSSGNAKKAISPADANVDNANKPKMGHRRVISSLHGLSGQNPIHRSITDNNTLFAGHSHGFHSEKPLVPHLRRAARRLYSRRPQSHLRPTPAANR